MDNSGFLPRIRAITSPGFNPSYFPSPPALHKSRSTSLIAWLIEKFRRLRRYFYMHLYDLIFSSAFGYLTLNESLYIAVHENNVPKAQKLLSQGASPIFVPRTSDSFIQRLLKSKTQRGSFCIDRTLLASIEAKDSMLYMAVSNNCFSLVKELIDYHNYGGKGQHTEVVSLCLAVKRDYLNIVAHLIDYGNINPNDCVQPDCRHCKSHTNEIQTYKFPLYHACRENHFKLVKYLIESKNCDINQLSTTHETCLHGAVLGAAENRFDSSSNNEQRHRIVEYLLQRPDCNPNLGLNPLCVSLVRDNIYDYVNLLLQYGCDVDRLGWNLVETTKTNPGRNNYTIYCLNHPLNVCLDIFCHEKQTLTIADHSMRKQNALQLILRNANIYAMYECTANYPFSLAVQTGEDIFIEAIFGSAKSQINLDIIEPLVYASEKLYYQMVKMLVDFGFNPNTIMIERASRSINDSYANSITPSNIAQYLNSYCLFPPNFLKRSNPSSGRQSTKGGCVYNNTGKQITPFLALSTVSVWLFNPERHDATVKTIENLFSRIPIDFSIEPNILAFYYALSNQHLPMVYFCLQNYCPIVFPYNTIDFINLDSKNHFSYTSFHVIAACCRLASNKQTKRALFDAYARTLLRMYTVPYASSIKTVLAYMNLSLEDEDFVYDPILFEHLMSLPFINNILQLNDEKQLRSSFGAHYDYIIEGKSYFKPVYKLKHICRLKIREYGAIYCERKQTNMLKILPTLDCLPKVLQAYIFYTRRRSNSLIHHLLNNQSWNTIPWI